MDSPLLADDASSLPCSPDITPKPAGLASPVPVPANQTTSRQRRVIRQRAKTPFHDPEDSNDDAKEQEDYGKQPTRRPHSEVTMAQTMFSELSNINSKPTSPAAKPETHSDSVLFREGSDFQSKASTPAPETATNPRYNLFSEAADIDSRASVAFPEENADYSSSHAVKSGACTRQTGEYRRCNGEYQPEDRRRKGILELVSNNTTSPQPHERKQRLASDMRGASVLPIDMTGKNVNTFVSRKPAAKTKVAPERDTYEQVDDDQRSNLFSPSAVPPSRGNSPGATKTKGKMASKRKPKRNPAVKRPTKQLTEQASQRQSQPMKATAQPRRVAPVQKPLDLSSGGESSNGGATTAASDLQQEETSVGPSMPRQANFKPLKSPINPDLAATQDLDQNSSDASESPEEEDNLEDDNFEPMRTLSPAQVRIAHLKTRAAAQSVESKAASKNCSVIKERDTESQRRAAEENPTTNDTAVKVELKKVPKQSNEAATAAKTSAGETDDGSRTQPKEELGSATAAPFQTNKTNRAKKPTNSRVSGSKGQSKKNALKSKSAQAQTDRAEPDHSSPADHSTAGFPRHPTVDKLGLDVLEGHSKSKRIGDASVSQACNVEASTTEQAKIKNVGKELRKQSPIKIHPTRPHDPVPDLNVSGGNVQGHSVKHRAPGADHSLVVADADDEYGDSAWEDQAGVTTTLVNLTSDDQEATAPDERAFGYTDGRDIKHLEGHSVGATESIAPAGNEKRSIMIEDDIPAVRQVYRSPSKSHPVPTYPQMQYPTSFNPLKRCFPMDYGASRRTDPNDQSRPSIQSYTRSVFPASLTPRPTDTVVTPITLESVAKKRRVEVVNTAANSQNDNLVSGSAVPCILPNDGGDDVFGPQKQGGLAKRTAFVRKCISNQPGDNDPVRVRAQLPVQGQPADHITASTQYQQRARVLQEPDYVAQKMLAAITAPAAVEGLMRQSSNDNLDIEQAPDRKCGVPERPRCPQVPNVDDRKEAWKTATEPYGEGLGEMMHKAVNVILRSLKTKEDSIGDVVDDYGREGRRIVDRISAKHEKERTRLLHQYEQYRLDYIHACKETRRRTRETLNGLRSVDLNQVMGEVDRDPVVDRLRELQRTLQKPI